jgi:hypothetical protein
MDYPQEFSPQARARVETEKMKAKRELKRDRTFRPINDTDSWDASGWDAAAFDAYILRVFLAFSREAFDLGRRGTWPVDHVRSEAEEFLRKFTITAYYEDGHDREGHKFPEMVSNWNGQLLLKVKGAFQQYPQWHRYERELFALARQQAAQNPGQPQPEPEAESGKPSNVATTAGTVPQVHKTPLARNIDRLRKECGWSFLRVGAPHRDGQDNDPGSRKSGRAPTS